MKFIQIASLVALAHALPLNYGGAITSTPVAEVTPVSSAFESPDGPVESGAITEPGPELATALPTELAYELASELAFESDTGLSAGEGLLNPHSVYPKDNSTYSHTSGRVYANETDVIVTVFPPTVTDENGQPEPTPYDDLTTTITSIKWVTLGPEPTGAQGDQGNQDNQGDQNDQGEDNGNGNSNEGNDGSNSGDHGSGNGGSQGNNGGDNGAGNDGSNNGHHTNNGDNGNHGNGNNGNGNGNHGQGNGNGNGNNGNNGNHGQGNNGNGQGNHGQGNNGQGNNGHGNDGNHGNDDNNGDHHPWLNSTSPHGNWSTPQWKRHQRHILTPIPLA